MSSGEMGVVVKNAGEGSRGVRHNCPMLFPKADLFGLGGMKETSRFSVVVAILLGIKVP